MPDITWAVTRWTTGDDYPADVYHTYVPDAEPCWAWEAVLPDGSDIENGYAPTPEAAMAAAEAWRRRWGQDTVWQEAVYTTDLDANWIANVYLEYDGSWSWELMADDEVEAGDKFGDGVATAGEAMAAAVRCWEELKGGELP